MIRIYAAADEATLRSLADGTSILVPVVLAESDDEADEYEATLAAAELGPVVVTAEVDTEYSPIDLARVQAFHVDADGSGDLAWYAPQELADVIAILEARA